MATPALSQPIKKDNAIIYLNASGIYYRRFSTPLVKGTPEIRLGEVYLNQDGYPRILNQIELAMSDAHDELAELLDQESSPDNLAREAQLRSVLAQYAAYGIDCKVMALCQGLVDKLYDKFQQQITLDQDGNQVIEFLGVEKREYFLKRQAEKLMNEHNNDLQNRGISSGWMDIETAYDRVVQRFTVEPVVSEKVVAVKPKQPKVAKV